MRIRTGITLNESYSHFIPEINKLYTRKKYLVIINLTICYLKKNPVY